MRHTVRLAAHWALLFHIYVSMAGFTLATLFGSTGLALNHQDFGLSSPSVSTSEFVIDKNLVDRADPAVLEDAVRRTLHIQSPATDRHDDGEELQLTFAVPGARSVVTVHRRDGRAEVEKESRGVFGRLGDLHKGFDTGRVWSWTIDVAALLIVTSSMTGIVTLVALRARRRTGFAVGVLGVATVLLVYVLWVPR